MKYSIFFFLCLMFAQSISPQTQSDIPLMLINTQGQSIVDEPKITALMQVINNRDKVNSIYDTSFEYDGYIGIEIRGNTSQMFDKKSYSLETRTDSGTNNNVSLLGMPEENDWVLHGPYSDKSLMRNALAYHLGNTQGRWSPRTRFCEVFINKDYRGVYLLTEKIKRDKNRVDIAKLLPGDNAGDELTGGYILRIDRHREGCWISPFMGRTGSVEVPVSYLDPKYDELTPQQRTYIKDHITDFEYALYGNDFKDPVNGYRAYIDVISFIDYFIISELSRDLDGYRVSVYFHKDKDSKGGKINMSPLWDYNLGFGNGDFFDADKTNGWVADGLGSGDWYEIPFWWDRLREDPYFNTKLKYRWDELRNNSFSQDSIFGFIDSCSNVLTEAQQRNFQKFDILDKRVWPNPYIGGSYYNEVNYLKNWVSDRLYWLDSQINKIIPVSVNEMSTIGSFKEKNVVVYPNPFTDKLTVRFNLAENAKVELIIKDLLGKQIICKSKQFMAGDNEFSILADAFKQSGNLFLYTLVIDGDTAHTGKMIRY